MKKWIIGLIIMIIILAIVPGFFISPTITVSNISTVNTSFEGASRAVTNDSNWGKWWPTGNTTVGDFRKGLSYNDDFFEVTKQLKNGLEINIRHKNDTIKSTLIILPWREDSIALQWQCAFASGNNSLTKIAQYRFATTLKKNLAVILNSLTAFLEKEENIYGATFSTGSTIDTNLVVTKDILQTYPSTATIYKAINVLENYAGTNGAQQTGAPIMNVTPASTGEFQFMLAIPVNKQLPGKGNIISRRMVPARFIITEVKGGTNSVRRASQQLQLYLSDHGRTTMAMPFETLVTNRLQQPDSAQWITKIYVPVF